MKLFSVLYDKVMAWSRLPNAKWYLGLLSFSESSFFPIPPDVMLAPMCLSAPNKAWHYALITTLASVFGGILGYVIGVTAFDMVEPYLQTTHYWHHFETTKVWFAEYGFWAIFIAGFSPIPYKVFTISAGAIGMAVVPFIIASFIGRGLRFFLVAGLMKWGGPAMESKLKKYVDYIGWASVITVTLFVLFVKL
jgi:membrane protein YqaA with SNARE-associated domain